MKRFADGGRRHLVFFKNDDFGHAFHFRVSFCISVQNFKAIRPCIHSVETVY